MNNSFWIGLEYMNADSSSLGLAVGAMSRFSESRTEAPSITVKPTKRSPDFGSLNGRSETLQLGSSCTVYILVSQMKGFQDEFSAG